MTGRILLDLAFNVVPNNHTVFLAFPGKNYRLYKHFITKNIVFPELPYIELTPGTPVDLQPQLLQKIRRADAINGYYRSQDRDSLPARRLEAYADARWGDKASYIKGLLKGFFEQAKCGDLVVIPSGDYVSDVYVGEFLDEPYEFRRTVVEELYGSDEVPFRSVKWLSRQNKGKFSPDILRRMSTPHAFHSLDRSTYQEIYSVAYRSYVLDDSFNARFTTREADFSSIDNYYLSQIINAVAAISEIYNKRLEHKQDYEIRADITLDELVNDLNSFEFIPDLTVNIASPGFLTASSRRSVPLVAAALFALTGLGADAVWDAVQAKDVQIINSKAPTDEFCSPPIGAEVIEQIRMMGFDRWQRVCRLTSGFKERTGLTEESKARR